jgi:hypothetical protein
VQCSREGRTAEEDGRRGMPHAGIDGGALAGPGAVQRMRCQLGMSTGGKLAVKPNTLVALNF